METLFLLGAFDLNDMIGEVGLAMAGFFFLGGACVIVKGAMTMDGGNIIGGIFGIIAGATIAFAIPIMGGFFEKAGIGKAVPKIGSLNSNQKYVLVIEKYQTPMDVFIENQKNS
jgi:hypothetical protein